MQSVATTVQGGEITDEVAQKALHVSSLVVANMEEATSSGQTSDIVAATVDVYSGITQYLDSSNDEDESAQKQPATEQMETLKRDLKARATIFCDVLTDNSAPDADPLSSTSKDFLFSCQKIQTREANSTTDKSDYQASEFACIDLLCALNWNCNAAKLNIENSQNSHFYAAPLFSLSIP